MLARYNIQGDFYSHRLHFGLLSLGSRVEDAVASVHDGSNRNISGEDLHNIFKDEFLKKYSHSPLDTLSREEILHDAVHDHERYLTTVERNISKYVDDTLLRDIMGNVARDLPGPNELYEIMMSYRLFGFDPSREIRRPTFDEMNTSDNWLDDLLL